MARPSAMAVFLLVVVAISAIGATVPIDFSAKPKAKNLKDHHGAMQNDDMFEGDMQMTDEQNEMMEAQMNGEGAPEGTAGKAVRSLSSRWPDTTVPYVIDSAIAHETELIDRAMRHWELRTCVRFVEKTDQQNYVRFIRSSGCWSYVGMIGGRQDISIGNGCEWLDIVVHEVGHALGFFHEQSRPDRDDYIVVNFNNIRSGAESNFNKYTTNDISTHDVPYDIGSVMHYSAYAFSNNGQPTITVTNDNPQDPDILGEAQGLSCADVALANIMYSCDEQDGWEDYDCDESVEGYNYVYEEIDDEGGHQARMQLHTGDDEGDDEVLVVGDDDGQAADVYAGDPYTVVCYSTQRVAESEYDETTLEITLDDETVDHDERLIYTSEIPDYGDSSAGENDGRPYIVVELVAHTEDHGKRLACVVGTTGDREVVEPEASVTLQVGCRVAMHVPCGGECLDDFDLICNDEEDCPGGTDEMDCEERCDRVLNDEDGGEFASHAGFHDGEDYADNTDCATLIRAPEGKVVALEFTEFAIEAQSECGWDFVEIHEGASSENGPPIGRFCGSDPPRRIISRTRDLLVLFHSDDSVVDAGYLANYEFVDARDGGGNRTGIIDAYAGAFNGFVDMRVPDNTDRWKVVLRFDRKLRSFKINGNCEYVVTGGKRNKWTIENKRGRGQLERGQFLYFEFTAITSPSRNVKGAHAFVDFRYQ